MDGLFGRCLERETVGLENVRKPAEDTSKRKARTRHSTVGGDSGCVSKFTGQSVVGCDVSLGRGPAHGLRQTGSPSTSGRRKFQNRLVRLARVPSWRRVEL